MTFIVDVMNKPNFKKNKVPKAINSTPDFLKSPTLPEEPKLSSLATETYLPVSTTLKESTPMLKTVSQFPVVNKKRLDLLTHLWLQETLIAVAKLKLSATTVVFWTVKTDI
jgi:hypothetical protein